MGNFMLMAVPFIVTASLQTLEGENTCPQTLLPSDR